MVPRARVEPESRLVLLWATAALSFAAGCRSTAAEPEPEAKAEPYVPLRADPQSIGFFLTEFDASLRAWTNLRLAGTSQKDQRALRVLESDLLKRASDRQSEIVDELRSGPPQNRAIAAAALGFTEDPEVMTELLAALGDRKGDVVSNALLGLGLLAQPDTPCGQIERLLETSSDAWTRSNAAFALQRIAAAGGRPAGLVDACRRALTDTEPGVRAQAATTLGIAVDAGSVDALDDLLYDDLPLVSSSAAHALASIGLEDLEQKGPAARALVRGLDRVPGRHRNDVLRALVRLNGANLGEGAEPWQEWAARLP
jgi:HEAT repeat protein